MANPVYVQTELVQLQMAHLTAQSLPHPLTPRGASEVFVSPVTTPRDLTPPTGGALVGHSSSMFDAFGANETKQHRALYRMQTTELPGEQTTIESALLTRLTIDNVEAITSVGRRTVNAPSEIDVAELHAQIRETYRSEASHWEQTVNQE